ncbi:hypothetical protein MJO29_007607 [Puccinia striiformis f. sp. tritici]|nr:hypothetical protein Pst134EB_014723 [Puccinia striiformis f. sp. tritici]KAI7956208.1 hypothetical protein MJO29_007607 [Puccinia striiformis f. sp. tritici]
MESANPTQLLPSWRQGESAQAVAKGRWRQMMAIDLAPNSNNPADAFAPGPRAAPDSCGGQPSSKSSREALGNRLLASK